MRACARLYFERISLKKYINYLKLSGNKHLNLTHFLFSKYFFFLLKDFSRPGNNHLKITGLFQVFHDLKEYEGTFVSSLCKKNKKLRANFLFGSKLIVIFAHECVAANSKHLIKKKKLSLTKKNPALSK